MTEHIDESEKHKPIPVFSEDAHPWLFKIRCIFDHQLKTIADFLKPELNKLTGSVLDIGTGQSPWKGYLQSGVKFTGLDTQDSDQFNMPKNPDVIYYSGTKFPFANASFENAISVEVLEHIPDSRLFLAETFRILKPGGKLLLTVPWSARRHHIPHDYVRYTKEGLRELLDQQGFKNIEIQERGNDITTAFNKLLILFSNLIRLPSIFAIVLSVILLPILFILLIAAHLSLFLKINLRTDPLGYAVIAIKPK